MAPSSLSSNPSSSPASQNPHQHSLASPLDFAAEQPLSAPSHETSHRSSFGTVVSPGIDAFGVGAAAADAVGVVGVTLEDQEADEAGNEEEGPAVGEDEEEDVTEDFENMEGNLADEDLALQNGYIDSKDDDAKQASVSAKESSEGISGSRGKIFIGGLTRDTTTDMLTNHFKKYGDIIDSVIMKHRITGHPRGFGFVTFADSSVVDHVLRDGHILDGKMVEAKRTVPRDVMPVPSKGPKTKKIFVGGLKTSTTEDEFKRFFEKFGKITECQIMQDHSTGRSRGFGFITFDSEQSVEDVLAHGKMHDLDGKQVEIKKAEPKRADEAPPSYDRGAHHRSRGGSSYDANAGFYGALSVPAPPYYGGAAGGPGPYRGSGRAGGYGYGAAYGYGASYGGYYGFGDVDDAYGGMAYNYTGYGSGSGYGNVYGGGSYGGSSRGYSSGRYHPYGR